MRLVPLSKQSQRWFTLIFLLIIKLSHISAWLQRKIISNKSFLLPIELRGADPPFVMQHVQQDIKEMYMKASSDLVEILRKREKDLVTDMARAAAHINPKYVYGENIFACDRSGECFQAVVEDYINGTFQGSESDKADLKTNIVLQAAHFRSKRRWFGTEMASKIASSKSEFEFWVVAGETDDGKAVAPLAMKLLSCCSAMGEVERTHKVTSRTRTKNSNRKFDSTTEAYCTIAVSESNKRQSEQIRPNVMQAFRERVRNLRKVRSMRESAAQAISDARHACEAAATSDEDASDLDVHDGMDELLDEAYLLGYEFESSDDDAN